MRSAKLLVVLVALTAGACTTSRPLSKAEFYSLPPRAGADRVLAQLGDLLILPEPYRGARPKHLLESTDYRLKPHATEYTALCASEAIRFNFDPMSARTDGDAPARLTKIELIDPRFRLLDFAPLAFAKQADRPEQMAAGLRCRDEGYDPQRYFPAASAEQAVEGLWLLAALKTKPLPEGRDFLANCDAKTQAACLADFQALSPQTLTEVSQCPSEEVAVGFKCLQVDGRSDFVVRYTGSRETIKIVRIAVWETVTVGCYREE